MLQHKTDANTNIFHLSPCTMLIWNLLGCLSKMCHCPTGASRNNPPSVCVKGKKTQIKIDITLLTYSNKVSNTLQHKVQKDILWLGRWVSPCRWCCCYKLPMNAVNPDRLPLLTDNSCFHHHLVWFSHVSSSEVTSNFCPHITVKCALRKSLKFADCGHFFLFLCVFHVFSLNFFHVSLQMQLKKFSWEWNVTCFCTLRWEADESM